MVKNKDFSQYLIHVHVSSLSRGVHSPDFAHSQPSRLVLGANHCHRCTADVHHDSGPRNSEEKQRFFTILHQRPYPYAHLSSLSRSVHSPDFAHSQPSRSGLGETRCTTGVDHDSGLANSENFSKYQLLLSWHPKGYTHTSIHVYVSFYQ